MQFMKEFFFFFILIIELSVTSYGQLSVVSQELLNEQKQGLNAVYESSDVAKVITGKIYALKQTYAINSQFFNNKNPLKGTLVYDGIRFEDIDMQYDLSTQKIVVLLETKSNKKYVSVDAEKVSWFSIDGADFTRVSGDSVMTDGIYQLAYTGDFSRLYIKRIKNRVQKVTDKIIVEFKPANFFYVANSFGTFEISGRKSVSGAFNDKVDVKKVLKPYDISFSTKGIEESLLMAIPLLDANLMKE